MAEDEGIIAFFAFERLANIRNGLVEEVDLVWRENMAWLVESVDVCSKFNEDRGYGRGGGLKRKLGFH